MPARTALKRSDFGALSVLRKSLQGHLQRDRYASYGINRFCREVLDLRLWKGQRAAARLVDAGHPGMPTNPVVAIKTGHGVGKTLLGGVLVCWWLGTGGPGTVVVTSAPTNRQVEELLWREVNRLWVNSALLSSMGRVLTREAKISADWVAYGFSTREPERFQGWHAPRLRFLIDEANGFPENIWTAIDSCLTGGDQQLVLLGNAIVPMGRFYRTFGDPAAATMTISAREHVNVRKDREIIPGAVTRGWIRDFEDRYSGEPDIVGSRVDGLFPEGGSPRGIVPLPALRQARQVQPKTLTPVVLGLDVARFGDSLTVLTRIAGQRIDSQVSWGKRSTTYTANRVVTMWQERPADAVVVDDTGVGGGVTDTLQEAGLPVVPFIGGGKALDAERFKNLNAEAWWATREAVENGMLAISQPEGDLDMQLSSREYSIQADRRIALERKEEYMKRTGMPSPDHADSLCMAVWHVMAEWRRMAVEQHTQVG